MTKTTGPKSALKRPRKMAREPQAQDSPNANAPVEPAKPPTTVEAKQPSKSSLVLELLSRPQGATIGQLIAATGWLPHTTRAALTGLKKKGQTITSEKVDGAHRVYRATSA